jgi:translocation and assembly module TamB
MKVEGDVPRLTGGRAEVRFGGRALRLVSFAGELGYAPVGAEGTIDLRTPGNPVLDLRLTGRNALLVAHPGLRVRADLDLSLAGTPDALRIGGRVAISDALYTRARSLLARGNRTASDDMVLFRARRAPLATATLDVLVAADETIRIRTPTLKGDLSCDLRIRGTGEAPAPEGRVFFRDLLVEMHAVAALKVDRGEVRFPPGEPFDPWLDVAAHTRLKGYDLEVALDGRVDDADLRISSRPELSQDDALLLLATGYTREELEREGIGQAAFGKLASFLGAHLVSRFSGPRDPDERTFLDRFRFTVGKDVSRSGDDTIEAEFEASRKLFLRVERDRFDEYNGSVVWRIRFK